MSGLAEEHAALVALLRCVPKGSSWFTVTEAVLARGSALAAWEEAAGGALIPDPAMTAVLEQALRDVAEWDRSGWRGTAAEGSG